MKEAFHTREQVSRTMEYAFDDFALSQLAKEFGAEDYPSLEQRALNYRNVIDPRTGYAQGRHEDGAFIDNNPFKIDGLKFITEGAACHYTWFAPHDPQGLMTLMGGREAYVAKLDSMFSERRYWHGNEPCHQVAFMYNYADEPAKTQNVVRQILKTEYKNAPGGLSGNDDAGQMSAWYIFAAMGFYPACPATDRYELCGTVFDEVKIGNLTIKGGKETSLNGVPLGRNYITHSELTNGGELIVKEYK